MLKLVSGALGANVLGFFKMEVMRGSRGLFGLALMGFLFKLNVLENYVGKWERPNT